MNELDLMSLADPDTFQDQQRVHELFTELRRDDPVAWCPVPEERGGKGFWSITKYDDIQAISKAPSGFSSARGITLPTFVRRLNEHGEYREPEVGGDDAVSQQFAGGTSMITMDPPGHTKYRRMVAPGFAPQRLDALQPGIRARVGEILDRLEGQDGCEFVSSVAAELPIQMLAELLGLPQQDRHQLFEWSNLIIGGEDPDVFVSREHVFKAYTDIIAYSMELKAKRQAEPGDDLISMVLKSGFEGEPLSDADYLSTFVLLVVAGNETTRNSISGGLLALSENPRERQKLLDDPSLIPGAVDEIIRWVAPVTYMARTVLEDTEIRGKQLAAGDMLAMWYPSGNRDEEKYDDPFQFNVTRNGPRHLSFGYGQHLCIGWRLAEIQLTILLEEMLKRFPDIHVTGNVERLRSNFLNSIKRMDVALAA